MVATWLDIVAASFDGVAVPNNTVAIAGALIALIVSSS
jgi:hypothetical protein